jgi:hypothetical protein
MSKSDEYCSVSRPYKIDYFFSMTLLTGSLRWQERMVTFCSLWSAAPCPQESD